MESVMTLLSDMLGNNIERLYSCMKQDWADEPLLSYDYCVDYELDDQKAVPAPWLLVNGAPLPLLTRLYIMIKDALVRTMFLPSLTYNRVMNACGFREWYTVIDDTIILGALPISSVVPDLLQKENVRRVLSMNEESELRYSYGPDEWEKHGVKFLQLPTRDFFYAPSQDSLRKGVAFLQDSKDVNEKVYVHCKSGRVRSATVVAAYLVKTKHMSYLDAIDHLRKLRPFVLFKEEQMKALEEYEHAERFGVKPIVEDGSDNEINDR